ncbi:unnamed protein product, partial [Amoebophrya sp. A25]
ENVRKLDYHNGVGGAGAICSSTSSSSHRSCIGVPHLRRGATPGPAEGGDHPEVLMRWSEKPGRAEALYFVQNKNGLLGAAASSQELGVQVKNNSILKKKPSISPVKTMLSHGDGKDNFSNSTTSISPVAEYQVGLLADGSSVLLVNRRLIPRCSSIIESKTLSSSEDARNNCVQLVFGSNVRIVGDEPELVQLLDGRTVVVSKTGKMITNLRQGDCLYVFADGGGFVENGIVRVVLPEYVRSSGISYEPTQTTSLRLMGGQITSASRNSAVLRRKDKYLAQAKLNFEAAVKQNFLVPTKRESRRSTTSRATTSTRKSSIRDKKSSSTPRKLSSSTTKNAVAVRPTINISDSSSSSSSSSHGDEREGDVESKNFFKRDNTMQMSEWIRSIVSSVHEDIEDQETREREFAKTIRMSEWLRSTVGSAGSVPRGTEMMANTEVAKKTIRMSEWLNGVRLSSDSRARTSSIRDPTVAHAS